MNMVKAGGETGQQIVDNMSSQQSTSSTSNNIYATNNNPQKELIEDKKRKMTLPLDSGGGGGGDGQMNSQNQNNLTLQQGSNMLTGFTPTNSKKIKTYFTPVGLVNAPSDPLNKDLSNQIDFGLSLSTPQIEKFISEMTTSTLRTPGSALAILTPGGLAQNPFFSNSGNTSSYLQQNGLQDSSSSTVFDANNNTTNNTNNHTAYQLLNNSNIAHSAASSTESNVSSSNNSSTASIVQQQQQQYPNIQATIVGSSNTSALTPTTALINPLNIFGVGLANNPLQQQQQQIHAQQQNDNTGGSNVVLPAQNYYVLQPINKDQPLMNTIQLGVDPTTSTNGLQLANGLNNPTITQTGTTLDLKQNMLQNMLPQQIKIKDELQTVPIHPNNHLHMQQQMNQLNNNSKSKKSNSKQTGQTTTTAATAATTSTKIKSIPTTSLSSTGVASASAGTSSMMMASKIDSSARRNTDASSVTSSNDLNSPLNMDDQETFKLEKKRERNREAARKCRTRKLEKIAELEQQVKVLNDASDAQRSKIRSLQAEIQELHVKFEAHQKMNNCDLKY